MALHFSVMRGHENAAKILTYLLDKRINASLTKPVVVDILVIHGNCAAENIKLGCG